MKIVFILLLGLLIIIPSAFGVPIAEKTGLKFKFPLITLVKNVSYKLIDYIC